jgi:UDP-N-acetylmuramate: L-alanyl-gamma-D-glutamyl-meso-diaminopimelate ligase
MRIHFIGMGDRIMGDLATALCQKGHQVTGSDLSFSELALSGLESMGLVPEQLGWFPQKITSSLDKVIVGRQVYPNNPELLAAQQLGLPICSYPEYIYDCTQDKQRIVIAGSAERTLISVLVVHVLASFHKAFDYVVDAPKLGTSVQLSDAPIIILEGDINPSSPIDSQPQSLHYQHNVALISGIGWEHSDTYPTLEAYLKQLTKLADASPKGGTLIYCEADSLVQAIGNQTRTDVKGVPYKAHAHHYVADQAYFVTPQRDIPCQYADTAFMCAVSGAQQLLRNLAVPDQQFYETLTTFLVD